MAASKKDLFEEELIESALYFKALAHPVRIQILLHLAQTRTCLQGDISDIFPLSRTTLNQHMQELKNAGLIIGHDVDGKVVHCLNLKLLKKLRNTLSAISKELTLPDDFCCEYKSKKMGQLEENEYQ